MAMNNSDFQRLLVTNDRELVNELTKAKKRGGGGGGEGEKKAKKPRPDKGKGKGKGKGKEAPSAPAEPEYRDRAQERREGKGEYENIAAEFESLGEIAVDQSKFLGGDLEHTHLVKGLDFALLSKVRNELTKQAKVEEITAQRAQKKAGGNKRKSFETQMGKRVYHSLVETLHPHHVTFKKRLGNMSKALALGQRIRNAPTMFLPGRMAYEFDLDTDVGRAAVSDVPRTIYTSKEDAPNVDMSLRAAPILPESVKLVGDTLLKVAEAKKQRRRDRAAGVTANTNVVVEKKVVSKYKAKDADDDIFGGVGNYDPEAAAKEAAAKKGSKAAKEAEKPKSQKPSYFADAGSEKYLKAPEGQLDLMDVTVEEREGKVLPGENDKHVAFEASSKWRGARHGWVFKLGAQGLGYYRDALAAASAPSRDPRDPRRDPKRDGAGKKKKGGAPAPLDDAYGECFPESGLGHAGVDTGDKDSDEEGDDVKSKIERLKKLAGKKIGGEDTVSAARGGGEAKKKKMSEAQQLQKIENLMKKGNMASIDELDARQGAKRRTAAPRGIMSTPVHF